MSLTWQPILQDLWGQANRQTSVPTSHKTYPKSIPCTSVTCGYCLENLILEPSPTLAWLTANSGQTGTTNAAVFCVKHTRQPSTRTLVAKAYTLSDFILCLILFHTTKLWKITIGNCYFQSKPSINGPFWASCLAEQVDCKRICLVVDLALWKIMGFSSWDDDYSQYMESQKNPFPNHQPDMPLIFHYIQLYHHHIPC